MMTIIAGGELFTGNTAALTAAVIEKKTTFRALLRNWAFSYLGNFIGSVGLAYLAFHSGTLGATPYAASLAVAKTSLPFTQAVVRGALCNYLVCMAVYMASGASTLAGKMTAIWFPISAFIALGSPHPSSLFLSPYPLSPFSLSLSFTTAAGFLTNVNIIFFSQAWSTRSPTCF